MTYKIKCLGEKEGNSEEQCGEPYHGETDRNGYTRGCEHEADFNNRRENLALWKHCVEKHGSVKQKFEMVMVDRARNDATKRHIGSCTNTEGGCWTDSKWKRRMELEQNSESDCR